ncbi:MAG: hypothetical protein H8D60_00310 [Cryomorphaceae bacterium]|nr:hypothetical protein [Cryomorphaceae bacterium]
MTNTLISILLQSNGTAPVVRLLGFFIAMIILYYIWNVRNKKKDADNNNKME